MGGLLAEHCMMEKPSCEDLDVNKCKETDMCSWDEGKCWKTEKPSCEDLDVNKCKEADMCSWDKGKCWKTEKPSCGDLGANKCEEAEMCSWDEGKCWKTETPSCEDLDVNKCEEAEMCSWDKGKCWKMEKNDQCWDSKRTGDKYCDHKNNNAECGWDGGDCCGDSGLKFSKNQFKDCNKESGLCDCFDPDFTPPTTKAPNKCGNKSNKNKCKKVDKWEANGKTMSCQWANQSCNMVEYVMPNPCQKKTSNKKCKKVKAWTQD